MTHVYLAQHAKAYDKEEDENRPLTPEGEKDATRVAKLLEDADLGIEGVFHSGKTRAQQTAGIFCEILAPECEIKEIEGLSWDSDPAIIEEHIQNSDGPQLYVGHLPHMEKLSAYLVNDDNNADEKVVNFHNGGIVSLKSENNGFVVDWIVIPELLGQEQDPTSDGMYT